MRANLLCSLLACFVSLTSVGDTLAQDMDDENAAVRFSGLGVARGMRQYVSGRWGVVGVDLVNSADEPAEVLATFGTAGTPDIEFARRIQVPARSVRRSWVPIKVPIVPRDAMQVGFLGKLIDTRSGSEVVLRDMYEGVEHTVDLRMTHETPVAGIFLPGDASLNPEAGAWAYEAVIALRTARGRSRRLVTLAGRHVPSTPMAFDGLDELVLYNNRFAEDATVVSAIRAWVNDGGRLWIMLDQVDFGDVEQLLGNVFSCGLVDRVQLDTVDIQSVKPRLSASYASGEQYEQPVDFARVVTADMKVTHTVDQWPAAFWRSMGRGRVVFTTVGARAWIRRAQTQRELWSPEEMTDYEPTAELEDLPLRQPEAPRSFSSESFEPYLAEQIGYRVVSRTPILVVLGLFCGGLLVAGTYLARVGRLEKMAWLVPCAAVLASVPLIWAGTRSRHTVAPTVGQAQLIEVSEKDNMVAVSGLLAVYSPGPSDGPLGARQGGVSELDGAGLQGRLRRMVWTDLGQWHWENLHLPAGVRTATFQRTAVLEQTIKATGTFSDAGFLGHVTGPFPTLADAIIATPGQPCLTVRSAGAAMRAGPKDVLDRGQYVSGALLSAEQSRRREIYEQLLAVDERRFTSITGPTLLGWSEPMEMGFQFPDGVEYVGAALWSIPLVIQRPESGTTVVIPSSMITSHVTKGPGSDGVSPLFVARTGQWVRSTTASRTWLRFQIPEPIFPIDLQQVRVTMQITAPGRQVQLVRLVDGQVQGLSSETNPIGRFEWTLSAGSLPSVDESGGVLLGVSVDASTDSKGNNDAQWKMDFLSMEVRGMVP